MFISKSIEIELDEEEVVIEMLREYGIIEVLEFIKKAYVQRMKGNAAEEKLTDRTISRCNDLSTIVPEAIDKTIVELNAIFY